ncbi:MAG: DUF4423 domain-containing protein [Bdellovibrionaceae bacterium]|nr:DUF4423 domain-containing protein [Pseudobdellovibrionaceae bacterium]
MWKKEFISIIKKDLSEIKHKNPRYSLRSYSRKAGISAGALSDLLKLKRTLSPQAGKKILSRLGLEKKLSPLSDRQIEQELSQTVTMLSAEAAPMIENWYYFAILNILELDGQHQNIESLASRLNLAHETVNQAVDFLLKWKFIHKIETGYEIFTNSWKTLDGIPSESIRRAHIDGLSLSQKAIQELPVEVRDFTSFVFNGDAKQLEKVRIEVRKLFHRVQKIMNTGSADTVYKMSIQLFPIDQWNKWKTKGG